MAFALDSFTRRLGAAQTPPSTHIPTLDMHDTLSAPLSQELRILRSALDAARNRFDHAAPEFIEAATYDMLAADARYQAVSAQAQREMEIRAIRKRIAELQLRVADEQERRGRQKVEDELHEAMACLHDLETRPMLPTDGHSETRRELLRRIGWLSEGVAS